MHKVNESSNERKPIKEFKVPEYEENMDAEFLNELKVGE
jgi:hypothetical protein